MMKGNNKGEIEIEELIAILVVTAILILIVTIFVKVMGGDTEFVRTPSTESGSDTYFKMLWPALLPQFLSH